MNAETAPTVEPTAPGSILEAPGSKTTGRTVWDLVAALSWIVFSIVAIGLLVWWVYSVLGRMPWCSTT